MTGSKKKFKGKQHYFKESKNTWIKSKPFLTPEGHRNFDSLSKWHISDNENLG